MTRTSVLVGEARVLGRDAALLRATCRNLYVMRWTGACRLDDLQTVFDEIQVLLSRYDRVAVLSLLDPGCRPPDAAARRLVAAQQARLADRLAMVNLVGGQGFWASITLNALLGIRLLRPNSAQKEQVFRSSEEACQWLRERVEGRPSAAELMRLVGHLRGPAAQSDSQDGVASHRNPG